MATPKEIIFWIGRNAKRTAVTVVGVTLILGGLALLVLPGPGLLVIIAGLAVLATQYAWAERALEAAKQRARSATQKARSRMRRRRVS